MIHHSMITLVLRARVIRRVMKAVISTCVVSSAASEHGECRTSRQSGTQRRRWKHTSDHFESPLKVGHDVLSLGGNPQKSMYLEPQVLSEAKLVALIPGAVEQPAIEAETGHQQRRELADQADHRQNRLGSTPALLPRATVTVTRWVTTVTRCVATRVTRLGHEVQFSSKENPFAWGIGASRPG